jgi:hypothetical protein
MGFLGVSWGHISFIPDLSTFSVASLFFGSFLPSLSRKHQGLANMVYQIGNVYGITAIAVIGGGLFGFDISSMSAM